MTFLLLGVWRVTTGFDEFRCAETQPRKYDWLPLDKSEGVVKAQNSHAVVSTAYVSEWWRTEALKAGGLTFRIRQPFSGKPFNPQPLIYHLTNRPEVRYSSVKVPLTVSPLPPPLLPKLSPLSHSGRVASPFRMNTCKGVSKQTASTTFRMNTCEKPGGGGGIPTS